LPTFEELSQNLHGRAEEDLSKYLLSEATQNTNHNNHYTVMFYDNSHSL